MKTCLAAVFLCGSALSLVNYNSVEAFSNVVVSHPKCTRESSLNMGLIDDLKLIFSEEGKKNRAEYERRQIEEQEAAQREILERRRNPEKMQEYMQDRRDRLNQLSEDRAVYDFQNKVEKDYDPLTDWKRLKDEGKIQIGEDLQRDESSSRLGSEGLQEVRVDERMPYIDQGYVEEKAEGENPVGDFFGNLFGKK